MLINHNLPQQNSSSAGLQRPSSIQGSDGEMDPRLYNDHLRPLTVSEQNWSAYNFFALWMSVVHNVAGYMIAGTLFSLRLSSWQILLCLLIGILFLELFCDLCSMPSQRTGIPFPVISRFAFGIRGANIPAVVCVILTTAWYSVQTYLASRSLVVVLLKFFPTLAPLNDLQHYGFLGLSLLGYIAFCVIWILQMFLFFMGMNAIRRFTDWAGPAVYFVIVGLAVYLIAKAGIGNISLNLSAGEPLRFWESIPVMLSAIGISISSYAVALLNFGIFARYGKTFGAVRLGNFLGLPVNYLFFSVLTVVITSATKPVFGELVTDPIDVMAKIDTWAAVLIGGITFVVATVGINVAANFTLPAFNLSNLSPQRISWRMGGMVTSISSFLILPWMWWSNPVVIHYTLGTLGALIGPFVGILLSAYYLVHRKQIRINALYSFDRCGPYWYWNGFNPNAIVSVLFAGLMAIAALVLPSLLSAGKTADPSVKWISDMSFTVGLSLGAISFVLLENILPLLLNEMRAKGKENTNEIRLNQTKKNANN